MLELKKKYTGTDVSVADINNRGPHSGFCHYLSGKLSSCTSAVVSGDKLMCRNYTGSVWQKPFPPLPLTATHMCAGSEMCLRRVHRGRKMISSCLIIFSSCFFFLFSCILFSHSLRSFIFTMFWSWRWGGQSTASLIPRCGQRGPFFIILFFYWAPTSVSVIRWSERSIQSDVFINHHCWVAHVGGWCNSLTRPRSQRYEQICPPDSLMSVGPIRSPENDICSLFCFLLYVHFLLAQTLLFFFSNWLKYFYSFTSCSLSQL